MFETVKIGDGLAFDRARGGWTAECLLATKTQPNDTGADRKPPQQVPIQVGVGAYKPLSGRYCERSADGSEEVNRFRERRPRVRPDRGRGRLSVDFRATAQSAGPWGVGHPWLD